MTTAFVFNPFTGNFDTVTASINAATDITGVLPIANGGTNNSSAYTAGSIIFSDGTSLTQDNAKLFWDDTNFRLGVGTNTPTFNLQNAGTTQLVSTINLPGMTANLPLHLDVSGNVTSGAINVGSGSQVFGVLQVANGGTNSATALSNNRLIVSSGGSIIENGALSATAPMRTNGSGLPTTGNLNLGTEVTGVLTETFGGTAQSSWNTGDILYSSASNVLSKRNIGSTGDVLTVAGGVPTWAPATAPAINYAESSTCGTFSTTSATFVDVTNLTATITTTGRPVMLQLVADGDLTVGNESFIAIAGSIPGGIEAVYQFVEGSTAIAVTGLFGITQIQTSASSCSHFYVPAAGTYTYKVQAKVGLASGTTNAYVLYSKLVAREL